MIITRTGEAVDFRLTETRRVAIDASRVASASQVVERAADGMIVNALVLIMGRSEAPIRVQASAAEIAAMHASLVEIMSETTTPALVHHDTTSDEREQLIH